MRELTESLAKSIYESDIDLVIEGGHDCRFVKEVPVIAGQGARAYESVAYTDLQMRDKDIYFETAEAVIKGGAVSSFYDRTGVRRP